VNANAISSAVVQVEALHGRDSNQRVDALIDRTVGAMNDLVREHLQKGGHQAGGGDTGITLLVFQRSAWAFHKVRWPGFYGQVNQAR
jgi:hypothetical protein